MAQRDTPTTDEGTGPGPRVPGVGDDPRDEKDVPDPDNKIWFSDLDEAVIEADRCIQCGTCEAACPSDSIGVDDLDGRPTLVKMCTGCSLCWDFCPRSGLRYERINAHVENQRRFERNVVAATASDEGVAAAGQNGGAVTGLLAALLDDGTIDAAVVARESEEEPLKGEAFLATTPEEVYESAGSFYTQTMQVGRVSDLVAQNGLEDSDVALVGPPCVANGAAALQEMGREEHLDQVVLTIALMCTQSFEYDRLRSLLIDEGIDLESVDTLSLIGGGLRAYDEGGELLVTAQIDDFGAATMPGCDECADFTGQSADISAGNVGSSEGETTLVVQSAAGQDALETATAAGALTSDPLETTAALERLAEWNHNRAASALERDFDDSGNPLITYNEHRAAYDGTDRAPAPHNPARVYQYERWC